MLRHCWQTTVSAWPKPRSSTGPPQFGQEIACVFTTGGATSELDTLCPPFKLAQILQLQLFEFDPFAQKQQGRIFTVVERSESAT